MKKEELITTILGIPKSIYLNVKVFGLVKGISLPILVSHRTRIKHIYKGCINIPDKCSFASIKIGVNFGPFERGRRKTTYINIKSGKVVFNGKANIASDSVLNVNSGRCIFGDNFTANNGFICSCENHIEFGRNVLFGWNCTIIDGDGHKIVDCNSQSVINEPRPIVIGDNVWSAANSIILKGTFIKDNTIIASGSTVNGIFDESNVIIAGKPANIVKRNIEWIR